MSVRVYVQKVSTGAIWSSVMPSSGVWRKESLGVGYSKDTRPVGSVTQGFYPKNRKNRRKFVTLH